MTRPTIDDIKGWTVMEKMYTGFKKITDFLKEVITKDEIEPVIDERLVEVVEPVLEPVIQSVNDLTGDMTVVHSDILELKNKDNQLYGILNDHGDEIGYLGNEIDNVKQDITKIKINGNSPTDEGFIIQGAKPSLSTAGIETVVEGNTTKIQLDESADMAINETIPYLTNQVSLLWSNTINVVNNKDKRSGLKIVGGYGMQETTTQDDNFTTVEIGMSTSTQNLLTSMSQDITTLKKKPDYDAMLSEAKIAALKKKDYLYCRGTFNDGTKFALQGVVNEVDNGRTYTSIKLLGDITTKLNNVDFNFVTSFILDKNSSGQYFQKRVEIQGINGTFIVSSMNGMIIKYNEE